MRTQCVFFAVGRSRGVVLLAVLLAGRARDVVMGGADVDAGLEGGREVGDAFWGDGSFGGQGRAYPSGGPHHLVQARW
jgi:hypothetical protein